jgi:nucleoside-diphosphate-sugar epimerase
MRVLFLGGAGMIGSAVGAALRERGDLLTIVTRGPAHRPVPDGTEHLIADVYDPDEVADVLGRRDFDVVVHWVGFRPEQLSAVVDVVGARTGQFVFVSTCSVFERPAPHLPMTESSPRRHNRFAYARDKLACELLLEQEYRRTGLPLTIVRPAHTYDQTVVPVLAGWTAVARMRAAKPVVVHGDGTSLWTLMHTTDFARAVLPVLGNSQAVGESVNVVSGDILTWDQIHAELAAAAGVPTPVLVHRSSETIARHWPGWSDVLAEDFRHSLLFDTAQLQRLSPGFAPLVSFSEGARAIVAWHDADESRRTVNTDLDTAFDRMAAA